MLSVIPIKLLSSALARYLTQASLPCPTKARVYFLFAAAGSFAQRAGTRMF
jgi:hypothetical protein